MTTYTRHTVKAANLKLNDIIDDDGGKFKITQLSRDPSENTTDIEATNIDDPTNVWLDYFLSNAEFYVYIPQD